MAIAALQAAAAAQTMQTLEHVLHSWHKGEAELLTGQQHGALNLCLGRIQSRNVEELQFLMTGALGHYFGWRSPRPAAAHTPCQSVRSSRHRRSRGEAGLRGKGRC